MSRLVAVPVPFRGTGHDVQNLGTPPILAGDSYKKTLYFLQNLACILAMFSASPQI